MGFDCIISSAIGMDLGALGGPYYALESTPKETTRFFCGSYAHAQHKLEWCHHFLLVKETNLGKDSQQGIFMELVCIPARH